MTSIFIFLSCQVNLLSDVASKSSDEYLLEEATKANNNLNYDLALDIITQQMSSAGLQMTATKELLASVYAGKCGLNFINYTASLATVGTGTAFRILMNPFVGIAADTQYCRLALTTMDSIGTPAQRTDNQNAFTAVTGMVLAGAELRVATDIMPTNGDGTVDVNICSGTTDAQINNVIIGFGYLVTNFTYLTASLIGGSSLSTLNSVISICQATPGINCAITDETVIDVNTRIFFRDYLNTVEFGIGTHVTGGNELLIPSACNP